MTHTLRLLSSVAILTTGGCGVLLGLDDFEDAPADGAGGGTSSQGGAGPGPGGSGGAGTAGGATGGTGNTGGTFCEPGDEQPCYTGPAGTEGEGLCVPGVETCVADGSEYGPCEGDVLPAAVDDCATFGDENCDGQPNDNCPCMPNQVQDCYTGPAGTEGKGICKVGTQQCDAAGTMFGPCTGDVTPQAETCNTPTDDDCDDQINEEGAGCVCAPNSTEACYTGPAGTSGVGICIGGQHQCNDQGTAYGPCNGQVVPATESCSVAPDEDCDGSACSEPLWAKMYGDAGAQQQIGVDVASDNAGNVYAVGNFYGTIDFGGGKIFTADQQDFYLAKFSPSGVVIWAKAITGAGVQRVYSIAVNGSGEIAITGAMASSVNFGGGVLASAGSNDVFVARYATDGTHLWSKRFGDSVSQAAKAVAFTSTDDVAVIGEYYGQFNLGGVNLPAAVGAAQAIFVAQLSGANGAHEWSRGLTPDFGVAMALTADDQGNVYAGGHWSGTATAGCGSQTTNTGYDGWVAKFDGTGDCEWSKLYTGSDNTTIVNDLDVDGNSLWALGEFKGSANIGGVALSSAGAARQIFLTRISTSTGTSVFAKQLGSLDDENAGGIAAAPNGEVHVGLEFYGTINVGGADYTSANELLDVLLARFDANGNHVWSRAYGDSSGQNVNGLGRNGDYDLLATGTSIGAITFGPFVLSSNDVNAWVARIGH